MSCIFLLRKHNGVPAKYRRKARILCGAKPQAQTGFPREKSLIFRVGQKRKHPTDFCGVSLMMPCGCVVETSGLVRTSNARTE